MKKLLILCSIAVAAASTPISASNPQPTQTIRDYAGPVLALGGLAISAVSGAIEYRKDANYRKYRAAYGQMTRKHQRNQQLKKKPQPQAEKKEDSENGVKASEQDLEEISEITDKQNAPKYKKQIAELEALNKGKTDNESAMWTHVENQRPSSMYSIIKWLGFGVAALGGALTWSNNTKQPVFNQNK